MAALLRVLFALLAGGAVIAAVLLVAADAPEPGPPAAETSRAVEVRVQGVLDALAQAKQRQQPLPLALSFTEAELTAAASASFPRSYSGATFSDPVVRLRPGEILVSGRAAFGPLRTTFTVVGALAVANGRPVVRVTSATLGSMPLPESARAALANDLQAALVTLLPPNLQLTSITVGAGSVAVRGVATP